MQRKILNTGAVVVKWSLMLRPLSLGFSWSWQYRCLRGIRAGCLWANAEWKQQKKRQKRIGASGQRKKLQRTQNSETSGEVRKWRMGRWVLLNMFISRVHATEHCSTSHGVELIWPFIYPVTTWQETELSMPLGFAPRRIHNPQVGLKQLQVLEVLRWWSQKRGITVCGHAVVALDRRTKDSSVFCLDWDKREKLKNEFVLVWASKLAKSH